MTRAFILGIGGQDGIYLARLLRARGHDVAGTARDTARARARLTALGVGDEVAVAHAAGSDELAAALTDFAPDEVYDLRASEFAGGAAALVETLRNLPFPPRLFSAGAGAMFGPTGDFPAAEATALAPATDWGAAKAADFAAVAAARDAGLFAVTGILFDHASRLGPVGGRATAFVAAAWAIAKGEAAEMTLTTPEARRDWGWAPEYVDAMTRMLAAPEPRDYVIATGTALTDRAFAEHALAWFKLDPGRHLRIVGDTSPAAASLGDPSAIARDLGWKAYTHGRDLVETLCEGLTAAA